jgi:hypothetical protein
MDYDVYCLARDNGPGKQPGLVIAVVPAGTKVCKPGGKMADPKRFRKFTVTGLDTPEQLFQPNIYEESPGTEGVEYKIFLRSRFKVDLALVKQDERVEASKAFKAVTDRLPAARITAALGGFVRG